MSCIDLIIKRKTDSQNNRIRNFIEDMYTHIFIKMSELASLNYQIYPQISFAPCIFLVMGKLHKWISEKLEEEESEIIPTNDKNSVNLIRRLVNLVLYKCIINILKFLFE